MPIDSRIALGFQRPKAPDQMQQIGNVLAIQSAQQQNALAQSQMDRNARAEARDSALRSALASTGGDPAKVREALVGVGDVGALMTYDKGQAAIAKDKSAQQLSDLKTTREKIAIGAQILGTARDEATYAQALQAAADALGVDAIKGAPANYDPQWVESTMMQALTAKERIDAQLNQQQFGETQRHNRQTERTAALRAQNAGPLAMTIGPDGTTTVIGGPNGIGPTGMSTVDRARGGVKRAEQEGAAVGKYFGERYADILKASDAALLDDDKLTRIEKLLDGVETGAFKGTTTDIKKAAKAAGVDLEAMGVTDDVGPVEAARALSNEMALQARNPAGGAGMPGAMSDADRQFLAGMQPGIEVTPEGRKLMIQTRRAINKRQREVAKMATQYRKENGRLDEGFTEKLQSYAESNPMFHAVTDDASYGAVPSGQFFTAPDGTVRRKP